MASKKLHPPVKTKKPLSDEECLEVLGNLIDFNKRIVSLLEKHGKTGKKTEDLKEFTEIAEKLAVYVKSKKSAS
ncbi:hypothetical protein [Bdellovibrio sp. HCB209]|uniref:hypothetical protein n=1 Tax=Bdellovibrio sp. HCB209 TaxID=3394354 RepID=UPI0039B680AF